MIPRFFGDSNHPLFGIYHPARGQTRSSHFVLVCPPIGHEYVRTHWAIRSLTSKLVREGMNVFRFDYRGTGDASGDVSEVSTVQTWVKDTCTAVAEMLEESNQQANVTLSIVGLRFGATIASMAAQQLSTQLPQPANLILWEPVLTGNEYVQELRTLHREMLDLWVSQVATENSDQIEELLGFRFQRPLVKEIEQIDLTKASRPAEGNIVVLQSGQPCVLDDWKLEGNSQIVATDDSYDWNDLNYIEEAWLPSSSPTQLQQGLKQFNDRLKTRATTTGINLSTDSSTTTQTGTQV